MGANDNILSGDEGGGAPETKALPPGSTGPGAFDPALVTKAVNDGLVGMGQRLDQHTAAITQYVQQALQGAQQRVAQGTATQDDEDLTQKLLRDPKGTVRGEVEAVLREQLAPYLTNKVQSDYEENLDRQRTTVDTRWGPGAFDKFILKEVEDVAKNTPNAAARGDKRYMASLVQLATGKDEILDKLMEHQTAWKTKQKDDDVSDGTGILTPGRRRAKNESLLDDQDRAYMDKVASVTGDDIDLKAVEEVMKIRNKNGFLDTQVMPGIKNKLPIKGDRHKRAGVAS